ncbi:MAG: SGNH/GDSL hydrolase family protein [Oligoflexales bacterium]
MRIVWIYFLFLSASCDSNSDQRSRVSASDVSELIDKDDDDSQFQEIVGSNSAKDLSDSGKRLVRSMAVLGDSFTMGFFLDTSMGKELPKKGASERFVREIWLEGQRNFEALADDLSVDFSKMKGNPYSATGKCNSHACELGLSKANITVEAKARVSADDLSRQAQGVPEGVDYVVLQVPAADFCEMSASNYEEQMIESIEGLENAFESLSGFDVNPVVLVVPPYNLVDVFSKTKGSDQAISSPRKTLCSEARDGDSGGNANVVQLCPSMLDGDFKKVAKKVQKSWYRAIEESVKNFKIQSQSNFLYAKDVEKITFKTSELALDCLHPNADGLEKIAESTWSTVAPYIR